MTQVTIGRAVSLEDLNVEGDSTYVRDTAVFPRTAYSTMYNFRIAWSQRGFAHQSEVVEALEPMPNGGTRTARHVRWWLSTENIRAFANTFPSDSKDREDLLNFLDEVKTAQEGYTVAHGARSNAAPAPTGVAIFEAMMPLILESEYACKPGERLGVALALASDLFGISFPNTSRVLGLQTIPGPSKVKDTEKEVLDKLLNPATGVPPAMAAAVANGFLQETDALRAQKDIAPRAKEGKTVEVPRPGTGSALNPGEIPVNPHNAAVVPRVDVTGTFTAKEAGLKLRSALDMYRAHGRKTPPKPIEDSTYGNLFADIMRKLQLHPHAAKGYTPPADVNFDRWCTIAVTKQATLRDGVEGEKVIPMVRFKGAAIDAVRNFLNGYADSTK